MKTVKLIDDNSVEIDGVVFRKEESKTLQGEPKFKVGQWVVITADSSEYNKIGDIGRISEINERDCRVIVFGKTEDNLVNNHSYEGIRHAILSEIESHLRKICDEKYVGKKVRSLYAFRYKPLEGKVVGFFDYDSDDDSVWYNIGKFNALVYEKGKWAEILPDKKPVPKTKEEFVHFMQDIATILPGHDTRLSLWAESFLSDYDFND